MSMIPDLSILPAEQPASAAFACDLNAIAAADRPAHQDAAGYLFGPGLLERVELADGYAFRYGADNFEAVCAFIAQERRCCPFFSFTVELTPDNGPLWLRITGGPGVKDFVEANFSN